MEKCTVGRPKLLHVFPTFLVAGQQVRFCDIINAEEGKCSHVIASLDNQYGAFSRINRRDNVEKIDFQFLSKPSVKKILQYRQLLHKIKPDLLITYNWGATDWLISNYYFPVCPMIHIEDGFNDDEREKQKYRRVLARKFLFRKINRLIIPSKTLENIARTIWKQPAYRVVYIPNGINLELYKANRHAPPKTKNKIVIGTVASIRKVKRIDRLIRCFQSCPSSSCLQLSIVGDGRELPALKEQAKSWDNIIFHGFQKNPIPFIDAMDIFAITSDSEQMPYTVIEAMALGKPILGTNVGDIQSLVSEANRPYIVNCEDEDFIIEAMEKLATNSQMRNEIGGHNSRKCQEKYDLEDMVRQHLQVYKNAILSNF